MTTQNGPTKPVTPPKFAVRASYKELRLWQTLRQKQARGLTFRKIADHFPGITYGDISRILKGKFPTSPKKRIALGLDILDLAPVCPVHNIVHDGICPDDPEYKVIKKRAPKPRRPSWRGEMGFIMTSRIDTTWAELEY
jgi:hypothetical protein